MRIAVCRKLIAASHFPHVLRLIACYLLIIVLADVLILSWESNADGSVDIYFGPTAPVGKESNWIQTVPGKGWFTLLRLYGALEPWFDKTWRPGEIRLTT
jgi:Protein of unknown function (DUF1214)